MKFDHFSWKVIYFESTMTMDLSQNKARHVLFNRKISLICNSRPQEDVEFDQLLTGEPKHSGSSHDTSQYGVQLHLYARQV